MHTDEMEMIMRYLPEKNLKETKLLIHLSLIKELHEPLTAGGEGSVIN